MVRIRKGDEPRRDSTVKWHIRHTPKNRRGYEKKMKIGVSTRSRWEILQDILDVIATMENRAKKTRIMKMAYLDWKNFQRHFGFLIDGGFIVEIDDPSKGTSYGLTERGKELRLKLKDLEHIVAV